MREIDVDHQWADVKRILGSVVAFVVGFVAFFPFLGTARCNGDCVLYETTLWGLHISQTIGATIGVVVGCVLAAVVYRALR